MTPKKLDSSVRKATSDKAWFSVVKAYNLCDAALNKRLQELGLKVGEHEVLANIARSPGITQQALANRCFVARSGVSMLLTRMETQSLLRREVDAKDGRIKRLYLSPKGEALAQQTLAIQDEIVEKMMSALSNGELKELNRLSELVALQLTGTSD